MRKSCYLTSSVLVDELQLICVEIDSKYFLVEFNEPNQFCIHSHLECFFNSLSIDIGCHHNSGFFSFASLASLSYHYNIYQSQISIRYYIHISMNHAAICRLPSGCSSNLYRNCKLIEAKIDLICLYL